MVKDFIDMTSGLSYRWNKEEEKINESFSCWSAKDQFGCKDFFILEGESIVAGPFESLKEASEQFEDTSDDQSSEPTDLIDTEGKEEEKYYKVGTIDDLYQLVIAEAELIRKYQSALISSDANDKSEFVGVFNDIIALENENIGKIQAMIKSLTNTAESIDDGEKKATNQLDVDADANVNIKESIDSEEINTEAKVTSEYEENLDTDLFSLTVRDALAANFLETTKDNESIMGEKISLNDQFTNEESFFQSGTTEEDLIQKELNRRYNPYCED